MAPLPFFNILSFWGWGPTFFAFLLGFFMGVIAPKTQYMGSSTVTSDADADAGMKLWSSNYCRGSKIDLCGWNFTFWVSRHTGYNGFQGWKAAWIFLKVVPSPTTEKSSLWFPHLNVFQSLWFPHRNVFQSKSSHAPRSMSVGSHSYTRPLVNKYGASLVMETIVVSRHPIQIAFLLHGGALQNRLPIAE